MKSTQARPMQWLCYRSIDWKMGSPRVDYRRSHSTGTHPTLKQERTQECLNSFTLACYSAVRTNELESQLKVVRSHVKVGSLRWQYKSATSIIPRLFFGLAMVNSWRKPATAGGGAFSGRLF